MSMTELGAMNTLELNRPFAYTELQSAVDVAIAALEEIQQYRAIGTVEEFRELKEKATAKKPTDVRYFGEAGYYIGLCPTCKNGNNSEYEYCGDCGQKLQWFERSEGKE